MVKKSQELKNKILKNLIDWCFDPIGNLVDAKVLMNRTYQDENSYWFRYYEDDELNPNWQNEPKTTAAKLDPEDYQEVKEAMINEIKQNPQDWKIEKESDLMIVKHNSGRKHWKSSSGNSKGLREEEWKEVEIALNEQQQTNPTTSPSSSEQQAQQEHMGHNYHRDNKY